MNKAPKKILFLGKKNDLHCLKAMELIQNKFSQTNCFLGEWGSPLPKKVSEWVGDLIVSYLSRWIVPPYLLDKAKLAAINFHPAPPEYPGIGCVNFALYENAKTYGATCHHMFPKVDSGGIISVKRFPVQSTDTVSSLLERTYENQFALFKEIFDVLARGETFPVSNEKWARLPFTRVEFEKLFHITPEMDKAEIAKRIRATSFGKYQPYTILKGVKFFYQPETP